MCGPSAMCTVHVLSCVLSDPEVKLVIDFSVWKQRNSHMQIMHGCFQPTSRIFFNFCLQRYKHLLQTQLSGCGSGTGSTRAFAARTVCTLSRVLPDLGVTLVIDFPAGDQQWAPLLRERVPGLKYIGVDAMPGVVQRNIETFTDAHTEFMLLEMGKPDVFTVIKQRSRLWGPEDKVAVISRHVFEHNTYDTTFRYLNSLKVLCACTRLKCSFMVSIQFDGIMCVRALKLLIYGKVHSGWYCVRARA